MHGLFEWLGLVDAIERKIVRPETDIISELVATGEIELGMVVITQIMTTPGSACGTNPAPGSVVCPVEWWGEHKFRSATDGERID